jgi:hypothetical protein
MLDTQPLRGGATTRPGSSLHIAVSACAMLSLAIFCSRPPQIGPSIRSAVQQAKKQGRTTATLSVTDSDIGAGVTFDAIVRVYSTFVAMPVGTPVTTISDDSIRTWYSFRLIDSISILPPAPSFPSCPQAVPPSLSPPRDRMFLPLLRGSALVDGVTVTVDSREARMSFTPGERYLFFAQVCPNRSFLLPYGQAVVFDVDFADRLTVHGRSPAPFLNDVRALGTLSQFRARVRSLQPQRSADRVR